MHQHTLAWLGGLGGAIIGLLGGALGTYCSIRNTKTPAERTLMIKAAVATWTALILLLGVPLALAIAHVMPQWVYWACFALFFALLGPGIAWINRRQAQLRKQPGPPDQ